MEGKTRVSRGFQRVYINTSQISELVETGRLVEWHWPEGQPPRCILPLGVATRELEKKLRLIYDGRYLNLWMRYEQFNYEGLNEGRPELCGERRVGNY